MDLALGQELEPEFFGFEVGFETFARVALEIGRVQAIFINAPLFDEQFPRPLDRFLLEIIAEGPVAEHLEEGVVVGVLADIVEVVVLATGPDALLRVHRAGEGRLLGGQKIRLELVHPRVGEEQRRVVVRDHRR